MNTETHYPGQSQPVNTIFPSFSTIPMSNSIPMPDTVPNTIPSSPLSSSPVLAPPPSDPTQRQHQRPTKYLVIIAVLLALLIGSVGIEIGRFSENFSFQETIADNGATATLQPTTPSQSQPTTPSQPQSERILYREDGADNWKDWSGSVDWNVLNGMLINDGSYDRSTEPPTITAPYQVEGTANYAIEARIRVLREISGRALTPYFGLSVRGTSSSSTWQGYWVSIIPSNSTVPQPAIYIQNNNFSNFAQSILQYAPFDPGPDWHTYRVEVNGNDIKVLIDGTLKLEVQDNQFITGGQVGLGDADAELSISSFKITTL
ncbi:MAG TPA: family 16 glycoside hydrolase [Ktedonobacteraceae bacterium]